MDGITHILIQLANFIGVIILFFAGGFILTVLMDKISSKIGLDFGAGKDVYGNDN